MSNANVPLCDLTQQYKSLKEEIDAAIQGVSASGHYILGPQVAALEQEVAEHLGARHAIGVGSGTDALLLTLHALGIGPGDEVITTPFTFIATTEAICLVGAKPVFVDIDPETYNLDVEQVEQAITPRTKAILPVHLYGLPCDMTRLIEISDRYGIDIVEDAAQAFGARWQGESIGAIGRAGCLSFFPSKNLGCFGDGGMVVTNDSELYERVESLRRHGGKVKYHHTELGYNSRLDELQAAVLRVKLPHLNRLNDQRRSLALRYNALLAEADGVRSPGQSAGYGDQRAFAVYHQYTVEVDDRDRVASSLREAGIGCAVYYPRPLHLQEVHHDLGHQVGDFPWAERAAGRCLSLPMFPELTHTQQETVASELQKACGNANRRCAA